MEYIKETVNMKNMDTEEIIEKTIYLAPRDEEFESLIYSLLSRGKLIAKYIDSLTSEDSKKEYSIAFTAKSADSENNNEVYKQLGDAVLKHFIIFYMYRRFPQLKCAEGVKVVARLLINYGSEQTFYKIANDLGFWKFISASDEDRNRKTNNFLLENTLKSFFGVTEYLLNKNFRQGVGYAIVFDILIDIFDQIPISLAYEDLYDAKTRLKELFDFYGNRMGKIEYFEEKIDTVTISKVYGVLGTGTRKQYQLIGEASANSKAEAQQSASKNALRYLNSQGYIKPVPEFYTNFCVNNKVDSKIDFSSVFLAPRGHEFDSMIYKMLLRGKLMDKYIKNIMNEYTKGEYSKAFTAKSANLNDNYEAYEQLGDAALKHFIIFYMYKRFPQLKCSEGVKIIARLLINYGAKETLYNIANNLGFWKFISASDEDRNRKMKSLLEDTLESFIGVTEYIINKNFKEGVGYAIVFDMLSSIFDEVPISLAYEDLYDAKTRLKELFDFYGTDMGKIEYVETKLGMITNSKVFGVRLDNKYLLGEGSASLKADAQQNAAKHALRYLNNQGYVKPIPEIYSKFCF